MLIKREEAFDLIRKFADESALVECSMRFPTFAARFRGRMVSFDRRELRLISDDTRSELALRIAPWMEFGFGDASPATGPDRFENLLCIFFRLGEEGEEADLIALGEIVG
jgi:hypothetical protein